MVVPSGGTPTQKVVVRRVVVVVVVRQMVREDGLRSTRRGRPQVPLERPQRVAHEHGPEETRVGGLAEAGELAEAHVEHHVAPT